MFGTNGDKDIFLVLCKKTDNDPFNQWFCLDNESNEWNEFVFVFLFNRNYVFLSKKRIERLVFDFLSK